MDRAVLATHNQEARVDCASAQVPRDGNQIS
jgi:hypothetical protein